MSNPWPEPEPKVDESIYPPGTCPECGAVLAPDKYIIVFYLNDHLNKKGVRDKEGIHGWICKNCQHEIPNKHFQQG